MNTNMKIPSVQELTDAGYIVDVWHVRRYKFAWVNGVTGKIETKVKLCLPYDREVETSNMDGGMYSQLLPNGGQTVVSVVDPATGDEFEGVAYCRNDENYNRKVGVMVALTEITQLMLAEKEIGYTPRLEI